MWTETLSTSCSATGTTVVLYMTGIVLARTPSVEAPFLHPQLLQDLSKLWLYAFAPAFCCHVFGTAISVELLQGGVISVFLWSFCHIVIAGVIGQGVLLASPVDESFQPGFMLSCMFGNAVALPIVLLETICKSDRFLTDKTAFSRGSAYVFTYTLAWGLVFWPLATHLLQSAQQRQNAETRAAAPPEIQQGQAAEASPIIAGMPSPAAVGGRGAADVELVDSGAAVERAEGKPAPGEEADDEKGSPSTEGCTRDHMSEAVLNPVNLGLFVGLFLALTPGLQGETFHPGGKLQWLGEALHVIGSPTVMLSQVILAGTLGQPGVLETKGLSCSSVALLCITRLVLIPTATCSVMYFVDRAGAPAWIWPDDAVCKLVLWLTATVPSAQSIVVLAQRFGLAGVAAQLVVSFAWQYLAAVVTVTGFTCVGLAAFAD